MCPLNSSTLFRPVLRVLGTRPFRKPEARSYTVKAEGQLKTAADFNKLAIVYKDGVPIRFQDIGHAEDSVEMHLLGYSLDNISLQALILSVGFVIDDAIVVIENIVRHREAGANRMDAALAASKEIGFTVLSMTISLSAVFLPIMFMGGLVGRRFSEFGMAIAITVLLSGIISLSLTPMLASRWLSTKQSKGGCPSGSTG